MNRQRFLLPALVVLTVARLLLLPQTALSESEQQVLQHAQEGHLWHAGLGPLLPWLVRVSTALLGDGAFGVRCFAPLLMLGAGWLLWETVRGLFDSTTASWSLLVFQLTPAVNVAAVTMTLTTVGIAASVGVLGTLRLALHRDYRLHLQWWLPAGALLLAFLADWRLILLPVSAVASMAITSRGRRALMKWPVLPVLGGCLGLGVALFWIWNAKHGWPALQGMPRSAPPSWWTWLVTVPLAFSPLLLAACGWALVKSALPRPMTYSVASLQAYTWPLVALDVLAWMALPWPHCGMSAWLAPTVALLAHVSIDHENGPMKTLRWIRAAVILTAALQSLWIMGGGLPRMLGLAW